MLKSVSVSHDYCWVIMRLATFIVTVTFSYKKLRKTFLKNIKEIFKKLKHTRRFDVLGRHYYVKNTVRMSYKKSLQFYMFPT